MKSRAWIRLLLFAVCFLAPFQVAQSAEPEWESIGPGIAFREFTLPGPNRAYVARMVREDPRVILDTSIAKGSLRSGLETVSSMAERYDGAINAWEGTWGARNRVVVAINGSFHDRESGVPETGMVQGGWYAKRFDDLGGSTGFVWKWDRTAFVGGCAFHEDEKQILTFEATGEQLEIDGINVRRKPNELILYTPQYSDRTRTSDGGVEMLVQLNAPASITPLPRGTSGVIRQIRDGPGSTPIPFDHVVLSAAGTAAEDMLANARLGQSVRLSAEITHFEENECKTRKNGDWTLAYASLGGSFHFLQEGEIHSFDDLGATNRHPRTAICYNDRYIYFVVVDGRQSGYSIGMNMDELGAFCLDELDSFEGLNQDGGGSSTMWINGEVVNRPSDGEEREVANGWLMIALEPADRSSAFLPGEPVTVTRLADVRLGPGDNYRGIADVHEGDTGVILPTPIRINGILAKNAYWWNVAFGELEGWVKESALEGDPAWHGMWRWHP